MLLSLPVSYALVSILAQIALRVRNGQTDRSCMSRRGRVQDGALQDRVEEQEFPESFEAYLGCRSIREQIPEVCRPLSKSKHVTAEV